ncbi:MAG: [LysW]-aminoadipate kinase [Thermoplasmatota archaeon]
MMVIKLGGGADIGPDPLLRELAGLAEPWILVHGGNEELSDLQARLGEGPEFITSPTGHVSRRTDLAAIANIQRAYRGRINNDLVLRLQNLGVQAVGLSGIDGGLLRARRKPNLRAVVDGRKVLIRDDYTGTVEHVNTGLLRLLLDAGYRPVVTLPAWADDQSAVNVDGDRAAAAIATAMGASTLINLSNVPGLLADLEDPSSLVTIIPRADMDQFEPLAQGRFRKKLMGACEAIDAGVQRVIIATAHGDHPLHQATQGKGTTIE